MIQCGFGLTLGPRTTTVSVRMILNFCSPSNLRPIFNVIVNFNIILVTVLVAGTGCAHDPDCLLDGMNECSAFVKFLVN
jgi:hypothetical protein